ncbi:hypothetical protein F5Y18DRAFT_153655 [Xylariaceae sp. FL1019]|nr:hypothetical protein F5Y18DRAFT_153655 [Xylariaceae sp. FL1019]
MFSEFTQPRLIGEQLRYLRHRLRQNKSTLHHFNRMVKSATEARILYDAHDLPRVYAIRPEDNGQLLEHRRGDTPSSIIRDLEEASELLVKLRAFQKEVYGDLWKLHKEGFQHQGNCVLEKVREQEACEGFVLRETKRIEAATEQRLIGLGCGSFVVRRKPVNRDRKKRDKRGGNACDSSGVIVPIALGAMGTLCFLAHLWRQ